MTDLALTMKITIVFEIAEPRRHITIVALDATDDDAAATTQQYADGDFDIDDLLGSFWPAAQIEVTENGETQRYTGAEFDRGGVLVDLDGVEPARVTFEDLPGTTIR